MLGWRELVRLAFGSVWLAREGGGRGGGQGQGCAGRPAWGGREAPDWIGRRGLCGRGIDLIGWVGAPVGSYPPKPMPSQPLQPGLCRFNLYRFNLRQLVGIDSNRIHKNQLPEKTLNK